MYLVQEDLEADFRVLMGVWDPWQLPAQTFIDTAVRLTSYQGTMRAEAEARAWRKAEAEREDGTTSNTPASAASRDGKPRRVKSTAVNLATDPGLAGMFEVVVEGADDGSQGIQAP